MMTHPNLYLHNDTDHSRGPSTDTGPLFSPAEMTDIDGATGERLRETVSK